MHSHRHSLATMPSSTLKRSLDFFRSLKVRLTVWNTLVVLIAVVIALVAVREGLRFYLVLETDTTLDAEVRELLLAIEAFHPDRDQIVAEMERKAEGHRERGCTFAGSTSSGAEPSGPVPWHHRSRCNHSSVRVVVTTSGDRPSIGRLNAN